MKLKCQIKLEMQMTRPGRFGIPVIQICSLFAIWNFGYEIAACLSWAGNGG
jgi:hypothetical protein